MVKERRGEGRGEEEERVAWVGLEEGEEERDQKGCGMTVPFVPAAMGTTLAVRGVVGGVWGGV